MDVNDSGRTIEVIGYADSRGATDLNQRISEERARAVAEALGLRDPQYGWHQGATLRSLTVVETGAEDVQEGEPSPEV